MLRYLFLIMFVLFISCSKKFLETPPTSTVDQQTYIDNLDALDEYLNGVYIQLSVNFYNSYAPIYPELIADNIKPIAGSSTLNLHNRWIQVSNDDRSLGVGSNAKNMNGFWTAGFSIARSCSYVLENVDRFRNDNPSKADNIKGQALAIRALVHYLLVNVFAQPYKFSSDASHLGIPYVTSSDWTLPVYRREVSDVYSHVIEDLTKSLSLVFTSQKSKSFVSRLAVQALLARVYLNIGDYDKAKELAVAVSIDVPILPAGSYPSKLFTSADSEELFQLTPSGSVNGYTTSFPSIYYRSSMFFVATKDIKELLFEWSNDKRRAWLKDTLSNWQIRKFPSGAVAGITTVDGAYYYSVIRSSEMYLTAAECYAKLGNEDSAKYYLNAIRKRSDVASINANTTGKALIDSIYKERRKELCFEGLRMFDLLRVGLGVNRIDAPDSLSKTLSYPNPRAIAPIHGLDVIYYNLEQNPIY